MSFGLLLDRDTIDGSSFRPILFEQDALRKFPVGLGLCPKVKELDL
jgi:hypothetical protein